MAIIPTAVEWTETEGQIWVCASAGLCATKIIQLNYVVILNYVYLKRQDIIKTANMVENYIKLRQDKVDYVLD